MCFRVFFTIALFMRGSVACIGCPKLIPSIFRVRTVFVFFLIGNHNIGIVLIDMYFFLKNHFLFPITSFLITF